MDVRRLGGVVLATALLALVVVALVVSGFISLPGPSEDRYNRTTVTVYAENGTRLGQVEVRIADTQWKRYTGLSRTERLPPDEGMLFTYGAPSNHTYVMREMDFGIDIVYVGPDGRITSIHHAPEPPEGADGNDYRYPGYGQYVLEVNLNWTTRHGVGVGDRIVVEGDVGQRNDTDGERRRSRALT